MAANHNLTKKWKILNLGTQNFTPSLSLDHFENLKATGTVTPIKLKQFPFLLLV